MQLVPGPIVDAAEMVTNDKQKFMKYPLGKHCLSSAAPSSSRHVRVGTPTKPIANFFLATETPMDNISDQQIQDIIRGRMKIGRPCSKESLSQC